MPNIVCNKPVRGAEDHRRFTGVAGVTQRGHRAWVCSALSKKELPHTYPAVTVPWKCGCVVFHAPGFKLKALGQLCPLELCPLCSSEGTELGTGSPVLRLLCQSDGKGTCLAAQGSVCPVLHSLSLWAMGTGRFSTACVTLMGQGEQSLPPLRPPICSACPPGHRPGPRSGCLLREISDISAAAAQVSVRRSQL